MVHPYISSDFSNQKEKPSNPCKVEFVKADLAQANKNRDVRPWIITMGHRPMYCSNGNHEGACLTEDTFHRNGTLDGVKVGLEEIFHTNKVDLCLSGHEHSYGKCLSS